MVVDEGMADVLTDVVAEAEAVTDTAPWPWPSTSSAGTGVVTDLAAGDPDLAAGDSDLVAVGSEEEDDALDIDVAATSQERDERIFIVNELVGYL